MGILYLYTIPDQSRGCSTGMLWYQPQGMAIKRALIDGSHRTGPAAPDSILKTAPRTFGAGCILHACRPALILPPRAPTEYTFPMGTWQADRERLLSFLFAGVTHGWPQIYTILGSYPHFFNALSTKLQLLSAGIIRGLIH